MEKENKDVMKPGETAPEIKKTEKAQVAEKPLKNRFGKTVTISPGEVIVVEKESGVPFVASQKL